MDYLSLILILIPVYIANATPVILGGGRPLDLGFNWIDNKRIFGSGKTLRGFIVGVFSGWLSGILISKYYLIPFFPSIEFQIFGSLALSVGTMTGDAFGSFIKRRVDIPQGNPFFLDSIMFLVFALVAVFPFVNTSIYRPFNLLFLFLLTVVLHPLTNLIANKAGLKNVPW